MVKVEQKITPLLWFANEAEEAVNFYVTLFPDSKIDNVSRYGEAGPGKEGDAMMIEFTLAGQEFMALNGTTSTDMGELESPPRGGIALFVTCDTQAELDVLWDKLAQGGKVQQCGWVLDRYGFAWNVVPKGMSEVMGNPDPEKRKRAMQAMFAMQKIDLDALRRAVQ
jgi:predicted 3-demethylubiquinone-9 3-methyltransferase (glyoxalase superfamily)